MSFTNFGLIKRSSATEIETPKQPTIDKSEAQPSNLLPLINTGNRVVLAPQTQTSKEHSSTKKAKEEDHKEVNPSSFAPEQ